MIFPGARLKQTIRIIGQFLLPLALLLLLAPTLHAAVCDSRPFSQYEERVNEAYVAYYGRASDPAGLAYWANRLETEGGALQSIIQAFGTSQEFNERFGHLDHAQLLTNLYRQLFNRGPDAAGADFYRAQLDSGAMTLQTIALNVLDGTQGEDDLAILENKLIGSLFQTYRREQGDIGDWSGETMAGLLAAVGRDLESLEAICNPPELESIELDEGGRLTFYSDGLAPDTEVSTALIPPSALADTLTDHLEAIGNAYQINVNPPPALPTQVELPIPEGEDGSRMALARVGLEGLVTLLRTQIEGGHLTALTNRFSTVVPVKLKETLQDFNTEVSGPTFIPVDFEAPYFETGTARGFLGLQRTWRAQELKAAEPMEIWQGLEQQDPMINEGVRVLARKAGTMLVSVEYQEPTTGIGVYASKYVYVRENDAVPIPDIAISGPLVVGQGMPFMVVGEIINDGDLGVERWNWVLDDGPSMDGGNDTILVLDDLRLDTLGDHLLNMRVETLDGTLATAELPIWVLDDQALREACEAQGNIWIDDACMTPEEACTAEDKVWDGESCLTAEEYCAMDGKVWDGQSCVSPHVCSDDSVPSDGSATACATFWGCSGSYYWKGDYLCIFGGGYYDISGDTLEAYSCEDSARLQCTLNDSWPSVTEVYPDRIIVSYSKDGGVTYNDWFRITPN